MMRTNRGFIAEVRKATIKDILKSCSLKAFAEEIIEDGGEPNQPTPTTINYEDLIAKARKEEKDKQYKTIEKYKAQIDTFTKQHNDDLLVVAGLKEELAKAEAKLSTSGSDDSETVKTLKAEVKKLQEANTTLTTENNKFKETTISREEVEAEVRAELEKEYEVRAYKAEKMAELKNDILVPELVMGTTKEEIDASIQSALTRSAEIKKSLGISDEPKPQKRTPKSPANPSVSGIQNKEISMEYLASLDVSSKEYAEVRKQLGLR